MRITEVVPTEKMARALWTKELSVPEVLEKYLQYEDG